MDTLHISVSKPQAFRASARKHARKIWINAAKWGAIAVIPLLAGALPRSAAGSIVVQDTFENSTVGTATGNPAFVASLPGLGEAVSLGAGQNIGYSIPTTLEQAGTVQFWVDPANYSTEFLDFNWFESSTPPSSGYVLHLSIDNDGHVALGNWNSDPAKVYSLTSTSALSVGEWQNVAISLWADGSNIYVNVMLSASSSQPWGPTAPEWAYLNPYQADLGKVDNFTIYDSELSGSQIATNAIAPGVPEPSTLLLFGFGLAFICYFSRNERLNRIRHAAVVSGAR